MKIKYLQCAKLLKMRVKSKYMLTYKAFSSLQTCIIYLLESINNFSFCAFPLYIRYSFDVCLCFHPLLSIFRLGLQASSFLVKLYNWERASGIVTALCEKGTWTVSLFHSQLVSYAPSAYSHHRLTITPF